MFRAISLTLLGLTLCGCGERIKERETPLVEDEAPFVMSVVIDMSGSFTNLMLDEGKAYEFLQNLLDSHFRERIGEEDRIIISQIGGSDRSIVWQGTPMELRRDFADAQTFRQHLWNRSHGSSNVHYSISQVIDYLMTERNVANGKAKTAVFVLSDMLDSGDDAEETKEKALESLAAYGKSGGCVGFYYVDQLKLPEWRRDLAACGLKDWRCEGDFAGYPSLPTWE